MNLYENMSIRFLYKSIDWILEFKAAISYHL